MTGSGEFDSRAIFHANDITPRLCRLEMEGCWRAMLATSGSLFPFQVRVNTVHTSRFFSFY